MVSVVKRTNCRLCESKELAEVLALAPIPLSENYSDSKNEALSQERFPLNICQCESCGHVQLVDIVSNDLLWGSYSYFSNKSFGMLAHLKSIADRIKFYISGNSLTNKTVIDIGSNDGSFLQIVRNEGATVLGVDPAIDVANFAISNGIPTIISTLNESSAEMILSNFGQADIITAFNVFAHTDDLIKFVNLIQKLLKPGGLFVFEAQYLKDIIEKNLIATFFHEHMSHHSLLSLEPFLRERGLMLFHAEQYPIQHGSIVGYCLNEKFEGEKSKELQSLLLDESRMMLTSKSSMEALRSKFESGRGEVHRFLNSKKNDGFEIVGYGASRSGPTLIIQYKLEEFLRLVIDDDESKYKRFETGSGLEIVNSKFLYDEPRTVAVILAWVQVQRIIERNDRFIRSGGEFLILSPSPYVYSSRGVEYLVGG